MNRRQDQSDPPEPRQIQPGLIGEIEELQGIMAYLAPVQQENRRGAGESSEREEREPPGKNKPNSLFQPDQEVVRIKCRKLNERQVAPLLLLFRCVPALLRSLEHKCDIFFPWRLVPEFNRLEVVGKPVHVVERNGDAGSPGVCLRHLFEAALAIEETHQPPGLGRKVEHGIYPWHKNSHHRPAIDDVFFEDNIRVKAGAGLCNQPRWNLRQSHIKCAGQIHGRVSMRRVEFMPGRSDPGAPINSTMPSKVPLVGSTIGLNSTTLALCSCPGKSET